MNELTLPEIQAQGSAMANYLHRTVIDLTARLADAEGNLAVTELRLRNANKRIEELTPKPADV